MVPLSCVYFILCFSSVQYSSSTVQYQQRGGEGGILPYFIFLLYFPCLADHAKRDCFSPCLVVFSGIVFHHAKQFFQVGNQYTYNTLNVRNILVLKQPDDNT